MVKNKTSSESCVKGTDSDSNGESFYRQSTTGANGSIDVIQWDESGTKPGWCWPMGWN